jgi:hypothetical protein
MELEAATQRIGELEGLEEETVVLRKRVRELDPARNRSQVLDLLARTRVLRASLASMAKKRAGMEQNLETLRQSQLNQNMLLSMKHTTDALQTLGLKVSDADNIMLDLEESTGDINALQGALSAGFDAELSQEDLDAELELVLSDDALCPAAYKRPARAPKSAPAEQFAAAEPALEQTQEQEKEQEKEQERAQERAQAQAEPAAEPILQQQPNTTLAEDAEAQADKQ